MARTSFYDNEELGIIMEPAYCGHTTSACMYIEDESSDQSLTLRTHVTPSFQYVPR